ncbi:hypothetical protein JRO89_XS07G0239800 [Xanthoceras sorbifolium]|uniref:Uncharacterized protein n=1 Tax=Xanthoceras sorbifolium TaxID=99658 RepID=A0ABQ8HUR1_9ROSI|nr:hypothetical protein JRO89_XS07G0239800 [Xanthoceras sorbifolium]
MKSKTIRLAMARQRLLTPPPLSTSQTGLAAMSILLCAFALFMCASHTRKWRRSFKAACYDFIDEEPVIELQHETVTEFHEYQLQQCHHESMVSGEQEQQGISLWQKNILMGGKCQLPDFSGVIIYDAEGNVVAPAKTAQPLLTWK